MKVDATGETTVVAVAGNRRSAWVNDAAFLPGRLIFGVVGVDESANVYVRVLGPGDSSVFKIDTAGTVTTGPSWAGSMAVDRGGNLYIIDSNRVRMVNPAGTITTIAGNGTRGFSGDGGPAPEASLRVSRIAVDRVGNLYISDSQNSRVRMVDAAGIITTVAGNGTREFSGDGGPATEAGLENAGGIAVDRVGNLYIADSRRVRMVNPAGIITTVAGNETPGFSGDGGPATEASLWYASNVAVDRVGNLYIDDSRMRGNRVRRVDTTGTITTVVGGGSHWATVLPLTLALLRRLCSNRDI